MTLQVTLALTQCDTPTTHNSSLALALGELAAAGEKARGQQGWGGRWEGGSRIPRGSTLLLVKLYTSSQHTDSHATVAYETWCRHLMMDLTMIVPDKQ